MVNRQAIERSPLKGHDFALAVIPKGITQGFDQAVRGDLLNPLGLDLRNRSCIQTTGLLQLARQNPGARFFS